MPTSTLTEFDLVMRNRGYTGSEIKETWNALAPVIGSRIVATTPAAHLTAAEMRSKGLTYFDSLIAALIKEMGSTVVTRDSEISKHVKSEW